MNTARKIVIAAAALASLIALPAHAGGIGGDLINIVAPGVGTALDNLNHNLGNPVDKAAANVINGYVPGLGGLATMNSGNLHGTAAMRPIFPVQQPQMGNFCGTHVGKFGPGPFAPLGSPCQTPYGPGAIVR